MKTIKLNKNPNRISGVEVETDLQIIFGDNVEMVFITNYSDETNKVYQQIELDKRDAIDIAKEIIKHYK